VEGSSHAKNQLDSFSRLSRTQTCDGRTDTGPWLEPLERGADLHMAQLMPLPLTVSFFSEIQIGFTCLLSVHPGSPEKGPVKRVSVS